VEVVREKREILTIVNIKTAFSEYRYTALDAGVVELLKDAYDRGPAARRSSSVSLKLLECVAQLLGLRLTRAPFSVGAMWKLFPAFVGALNSERFISAPQSWRHAQTTTFRLSVEKLRDQGLLVPPLHFTSHSNELSDSLLPYIDSFESAKYDGDTLYHWKGWWSSNLEGRPVFFHLHDAYHRLGRRFTSSLFEALDTDHRKRRDRSHKFARPFSEFVGQYEVAISEAHLRDPEFVAQMWHDFFSFYAESRHEKGNQVTTIMTAWQSAGRRFVEGLESTGFVVKPEGGLLVVPSKSKRGAHTNLRKTADGTEVKARLLTEVPLHFTDSEAMEVLFNDINRDIDLIEQWAQTAFETSRQAVKHRSELAASGTPRIVQKFGVNTKGHKFLVDKNNPDAMANISATFEMHGYLTKQDARTALLYPIAEAPRLLGLPTPGAFLPHLALLVRDHPKITPSFLEKLELFNRAGQKTGYTSTGGGSYLNGAKDRAGVWQEIPLTPRGIEVVDSLIEMTRPLRDYLRDRGDDSWRFLLLTTGRGFSYPTRALNLSAWCIDERQCARRVDEAEEACRIERAEAENLMSRFTLSALRASVGISIYLDTGSVQKMAQALGHAEYSPKLLEHYLPVSILEFFQSRWIRLFQTGMIVYAMKGSDLLLEASGLKSTEALNAFLEKHSFKPLQQQPQKSKKRDVDRVLVGIDEQVLSVLLEVQRSVQLAADKASGVAKYWASLTKNLIDYIETPGNGREELQAALEKAREKPSGLSFQRLVAGDAHV
jgi:hypothetical protein